MNENHDPSNGQFSDGSSSGGGRASASDRVKGAFKSAHAKLDKLSAKVHSTKAYHALAVKDRFTKLVPPGSKRDVIVKQGAMFAKAGLEKMAVIGAGGGPVAVAGVTAYAYASWGKQMAKQYGPQLKAKFGATSLGQRLSGLRDRVNNSMRMGLR